MYKITCITYECIVHNKICQKREQLFAVCHSFEQKARLSNTLKINWYIVFSLTNFNITIFFPLLTNIVMLKFIVGKKHLLNKFWVYWTVLNFIQMNGGLQKVVPFFYKLYCLTMRALCMLFYTSICCFWVLKNWFEEVSSKPSIQHLFYLKS